MRISMRNSLRIVLLTTALLAVSACTPHTTDATEVGVKFNKITRSVEVAEPGATYFFLPLLNDWKTYDVATQNLIMTATPTDGDRKDKDDLRFKTRDGNDIETDVTVRWRIDPLKVPEIWKHVAPSTADLKNLIVRPEARTYVRDVLNRLNSEDFYNPQKRFAAANDASTLLAAHLKPYGIIVEQVMLGNFSFKPDYQKLINGRKEAEKQAEKLEAEILATKQANQANLQMGVAELTEQLTIAQGQFEQAKRTADAYLGKKGQEAQAAKAEKSALAQAISKERAALVGSAGDAYVNLQLIDALQKKEIRQIPKMPGGNVIIDGNLLLQQLGVLKYQQQKQSATEQE